MAVSENLKTGPGEIELFFRSTQPSIKFIMLKNAKMPTLVGILTFISMINKTSEKQEKSLFFSILFFMSS